MLSWKPLASATLTQGLVVANSRSKPSPQLSSFHSWAALMWTERPLTTTSHVPLDCAAAPASASRNARPSSQTIRVVCSMAG